LREMLQNKSAACHPASQQATHATQATPKIFQTEINTAPVR